MNYEPKLMADNCITFEKKEAAMKMIDLLLEEDNYVVMLSRADPDLYVVHWVWSEHAIDSGVVFNDECEVEDFYRKTFVDKDDDEIISCEEAEAACAKDDLDKESRTAKSIPSWDCIQKNPLTNAFGEEL